MAGTAAIKSHATANGFTSLVRVGFLLAASVAWGALMALSAYVALVFNLDRQSGGQVSAIIAIYFAGGFIAFLAVYPVFLALSRRSGPVTRLGLALVLLALFTLGATAGVLALQYRTYYAEWHESIFSRIWFWQQFYTALGSTYQYAVIGTRLYWPLAPIFLLATSWWLSRKSS
jgi:hypothetical protein